MRTKTVTRNAGKAIVVKPKAVTSSSEQIFVTGGTGYLGSYVLRRLLLDTRATLHLLVRAKSNDEAARKLWKGLQLQMSEAEFHAALPRFRFVFGDLTAVNLGIAAEVRQQLARTIDSVLHIAASLNRKSEKACLNANLRGTLAVIQLAREVLATGRKLRRFSHVSTVAVAGQRDKEVVQEDTAVDWNRSDYDPYARTKKFCEHMVRELLPNTQLTFFRPSIVMGDSHHAMTTQFDMVKTFCVLADLPVLPLNGDVRLDIVNADYVGKAIATIHMRSTPMYQIYHLSGGVQSKSARAVSGALVRGNAEGSVRAKVLGNAARFVPPLSNPFGSAVTILSSLSQVHKNALTSVGSLLQVFWPYITYDTVFDNSRVVQELGESPVPFTEYCQGLYLWAKKHDFKFPYVELQHAPVFAATNNKQNAKRSFSAEPA